MSPRPPRASPWIPAAVAAVLAGCAHVPPGIQTADRAATERVAVRAPPAGWRSVAVVPFGGDPAHRRPAEELVALEVQRYTGLAILAPSAFARWLRREGGAAPDADGWTSAYLEQPGSAPTADAPCEPARSLAARVAADALVLGRVAQDGASVDLVLVDGATGEAIAAVRRVGSRFAAELGTHELAVSSTSRALDDLLAVLATPPGTKPRVAPVPSDVAVEHGEEAP